MMIAMRSTLPKQPTRTNPTKPLAIAVRGFGLHRVAGSYMGRSRTRGRSRGCPPLSPLKTYPRRCYLHTPKRSDSTSIPHLCKIKARKNPKQCSQSMLKSTLNTRPWQRGEDKRTSSPQRVLKRQDPNLVFRHGHRIQGIGCSSQCSGLNVFRATHGYHP